MDQASLWPWAWEGTLLSLPGSLPVTTLVPSMHPTANPFGILLGEGCHTNTNDINVSHCELCITRACLQLGRAQA